MNTSENWENEKLYRNCALTFPNGHFDYFYFSIFCHCKDQDSLRSLWLMMSLCTRSIGLQLLCIYDISKTFLAPCNNGATLNSLTIVASIDVFFIF